MLETAELLKKVRKLEIVAGKLVEDVIGGAYHSVFKGRGIEFDEVREYTFEDDIRDIDWNVSARLNAPYVKKYVEERELTVLLMVDISNSMTLASSGAVAEKYLPLSVYNMFLQIEGNGLGYTEIFHCFGNGNP